MESKQAGSSRGRIQEHHNVSWIDIENPDLEIFRQLEAEYHLHPVHLKESIQQVQHSQVEHEEQYLFFVLHIPRYESKLDKVLVSQVGIFLGKDFLITIRSGPSAALSRLYEKSSDQKKYSDDYFKDGAAYVLYILVRDILNDIFDMTEAVTSELDTIEDIVFDNSISDAQRIGKVRQKIVKLGRVIGPKKIILEDLAQQIDSFSGESMSKFYSNNTKTVSKLWEIIEEAKETVEIYKDADFTTSTEQTNQLLAILTLVFTFTIPITVVATLYGMNVTLPGGLVTGEWKFFGTYTTFGILVSLSAAAAVGMYFFFKRKHWF